MTSMLQDENPTPQEGDKVKHPLYTFSFGRVLSVNGDFAMVRYTSASGSSFIRTNRLADLKVLSETE